MSYLTLVWIKKHTIRVSWHVSLQGNHCVEQSLFEFATSAVSFLSSALVGYGEKSAVRCSSNRNACFLYWRMALCDFNGFKMGRLIKQYAVKTSKNIIKTSCRFQECQQQKQQKYTVSIEFSDHVLYTSLQYTGLYQHEPKTPTINWHFCH